MLKDMNIQDFLNQTASNNPIPGGGSVAALSSALASSLAAMVANLTVGKKSYEEVSDEMLAIANEMIAFKNEFVELIDKDANSFDGVMKAYKLPKGSDEEKAERTRQIQSGMKYAVTVPLEVAKKTSELFDSIEILVVKGNQNAQTDALVAGMMARTAILSALYNVKINLGSIKDEAFVQSIGTEVRALEKLAVEREQKVLSLSSL
jgi:formiminotetrahydrofolate cyclodeaminase